MDIDVWMTMDPDTYRISIQNREFQDGDFPLGLRGLGWERRTAKINENIYKDILAGQFTADELDIIHRDLWSDNGDPYPGYAIIRGEV